MRLPWQKDHSSSSDSKKSLKDMMAVGNSSTGSFESPVAERNKISKLRKEIKKSDEGSSSEDRSPFMGKKSSIDTLKTEKSTSLEVPKSSKHRRKSVDVSSLSEASMMEFQKKVHGTNSIESVQIPLPIANQQSVAGSVTGSTTISTPEEKKDKKKKKPKGLGPKAPKVCKDGRVRRVVSFSENVERLLPTGKLESVPVNTHECGKGEIPYHKRGKEEYKLKKALLRAAAIAAGESAADEENDETIEDEESEEVPAFNLMISAEDDDTINPKKEIDITHHAIHLLGPIPQNVALNAVNVSIQSFNISRYSPDLKGVLVIANSQNILPSSDESHFLKTDIHLYFDDWDSKKSVSADLMDSGVLNMLLKSNPIETLKTSLVESFDSKEQFEQIGLLFTIPIEELFLPALYEMLKDMGMEPDQPTFEVEGVLVLVVTIYKAVTLFRGSSLEGVAKEELYDKALNKLESLTLQNSLSNEKLSSPQNESFADLPDAFSPAIQITRSSVTEDTKNISAPELPKSQDSVSDDSSYSSVEISASFDALPLWKVKNSSMKSSIDSPNAATPESGKGSKRNSGSQLDLNDQLVLSVKFEIGFKVEKDPNGAVKSIDLLHVGYSKTK